MAQKKESIKGKEVSVLGCVYTIYEDKSGKNVNLVGNDGYCEPYSKKIYLDPATSTPLCIEKVEDYNKKVLRHELIHAFFNESGLRDRYGTDEILVDWIATQLPKMNEVFKKLGCDK